MCTVEDRRAIISDVYWDYTERFPVCDLVLLLYTFGFTPLSSLYSISSSRSFGLVSEWLVPVSCSPGEPQFIHLQRHDWWA
jgi:hypothetical protein